MLLCDVATGSALEVTDGYSLAGKVTAALAKAASSVTDQDSGEAGPAARKPAAKKLAAAGAGGGSGSDGAGLGEAGCVVEGRVVGLKGTGFDSVLVPALAAKPAAAAGAQHQNRERGTAQHTHRMTSHR